MKRFFSFALALCMCLSLITVNAQAITAAGFTRSSMPEKDLHFTLEEFESHLTDIAKPLRTINITALPANGDLKLGNEVISTTTSIERASLSSLGMTFVPNRYYHAIDTFKWTATDRLGTSSEVTTTLNYEVSAPVAEDQTFRVLVNGTTNGTLKVTDTSGLPLLFTITEQPAHGVLLRSDYSGTFTYTPTKDYQGNDTFKFTASNSYETSREATVTMVVGKAEPPVANPLSVTVDYHGEITAKVSGYDVNTPPAPMTYSLESKPAKGSITSFDTETGVFTYKHNTDLFGTDTFTFMISNQYKTSALATVTITVNPPKPIEYRDMAGHWGKLSAGVLGELDLVIGEQIQDMYYYHPERTLTRAEFAIFLNSVMAVKASTDSRSFFHDVTTPYLVSSLNSTYEANISAGTMVNGLRYFYPNRAITRIEAMRMVDNALRFKTPAPSTDTITFVDRADIPTWADQSIKNLVRYGIVTGSGGYLRPTDYMTRAEAAQILYRTYTERMK